MHTQRQTQTHTHTLSCKNFKPSSAWDARQHCSMWSLPTQLCYSSANYATWGQKNEWTWGPESAVSTCQTQVVAGSMFDTLMYKHTQTQKSIWSEQRGRFWQLVWPKDYFASARYCLTSFTSLSFLFIKHRLAFFCNSVTNNTHACTHIKCGRVEGTLSGTQNTAWHCVARGWMSNAQICPTTESWTHTHTHTHTHTDKPTDNRKRSLFSS